MSTWIPSFAQATGELAYFTQVEVSKATAVRITEAAGAAAVAVQTAVVARIAQEYPPPAARPDTLLVSADGAMVPVLHGEWAEVKTLAIGEVAPPVLEQGERVVHTQQLSYFSRLTDSTTFERLALGEVQRRGVDNARRVAAVMDGALWLQTFVDLHCPAAVRILDFPHAVAYISAMGETLGPGGRLLSAAQVSQLAHELKHAGPTEVLATLHTLVATHPDLAELDTQLAYLEERTAQLQYPTFQAAGSPIGSGSVESAHKVVVAPRMNGAGMRWAREHVNPMLALRNAVCNDRWAEVWRQIEGEQRRQVAVQRRARRQQRGTATRPSTPVPEVPAEPLAQPAGRPEAERPPVLARVPQGTPAEAQSRRPAADHPWRRAWSRRTQLEQAQAA